MLSRYWLEINEFFIMKKLIENGKLFKNCLEALDATDISFNNETDPMKYCKKLSHNKVKSITYMFTRQKLVFRLMDLQLACLRVILNPFRGLRLFEKKIGMRNTPKNK